MAEKHYIGEIGTEIIVDMQCDISMASGCLFYVKKPNGSVVTWDAQIYGTHSLRHIVQSGELDQAGRYLLQPYIEVSGWKGFGNTCNFEVSRRFE